MKKDKLEQETVFPWSSYMLENSNVVNNPEGMSKRFYAACAAMQGLLTASNGIGHIPEMKKNNASILISDAYLLADELLKQEDE